MTDHDPNHDDVLKELDAALDVEPSRVFADGVRARVHRSHASGMRMWWGLAAAASVGLATLALWRPVGETPAAVVVASNQTAPATHPVSVPVPAAIPERIVARAEAAPSSVRSAAPVISVMADASSEPRLEVITNQGAVLRALWAEYEGRMLPLVAEGDKAVGPPAATSVVVDPIVVPSIVVKEIGKEPGPAGATPIIRRANATKETR